MKPFSDGRAANDEFQSANQGFQRGELVRDLLKQRVQLPELSEDAIARPELDHRIVKAIQPRAVLFAEGPGGFGKSHAVLSALRSSAEDARPIHWMALNSHDNAPSRFLNLLSIALGVSDVLDSALQAGGSYADALALMLVEADRKREQTDSQVLVLDNVHTLTNPAVVALLQQLVTDLTAGLCVVLISRTGLPFETHCLELENRFTRLGPEAFEFSRSDTFAYFRDLLDSNQLTSLAVDDLYERSEGWPTPLALYRRAILSGEARKPIQESPAVERFLRESVLAPLTQGQIRSLRLLAELEVCSDELFFDLQSLVPDASLPPSQAADSGLPLRPVPGRGRWFRLNPLLQEWLSAPVMNGYSERMTKASHWYVSRVQFPEALRYALLAGNDEEAIRIASEGSEALLLGQDTASLLRLRNTLPTGLLDRSVRLRIVYSWVHAIGGQFQQARRLLESLSEQDCAEHSARIAALKAFILRGEGKVQEALELADQALSAGELSPQGQLVAQMVRSSALCAAGRFQDAREANRAASRLAREAGDSGSEALAVYTHARIELGKGALKHAEQLLRTGLETAMQELARPARIGETRLQLNLVLVLWHQGRYAEADRLLAQCGRHAEQSRDIGLLLAMAIRVLMCRAEERLDDAFVWIGRAERTMHAWQVDEALFLPVLEALKASCWLAQNQVESAVQGMQRLQPYRDAGCVPELFPMMPGLLDCMQVRVDLARRDWQGARETLVKIRKRYEDAIPWGVELHMRLLEALLAAEEKGGAAARKMLMSVVEEAASEHFISPFVELRNELRDLMLETFGQLDNSPFKDALARVFRIEKANVPLQTLAEPISDREQAVLELIAQGLSNQEIADRLHISLHTVKTHARRINAKLEVRSRTQAIVRARELGLL